MFFSTVLFFNNNLLTPLNEDQSEGLLTEQECCKTLKDMDSNKTPSLDGFTCEFHKLFWDNIKQHVMASINYGFERVQLSIRQRSIIALAPKKDKPTNLLSNLRPISFLNTLYYKTDTKATAIRLEALLPLVMKADQTGYIKGRSLVIIYSYSAEKKSRYCCLPRLRKGISLYRMEFPF